MSQAFLPIIPAHHAERCGNRHTLYRYPLAHVLLPNVPEHLPAKTEWNSARQCSISLFPDMPTDDVNRVVDAIENVMDRSQ